MQSFPEPMALSEENQQWVRDEIQGTLRPNGFHRVANFLRYWGVLGVCITAFVALVTIAVAEGIALSSHSSQDGQFQGTTNQRLTQIESKLGEIGSSLQTLNQEVEQLRLKQTSDTPANSQSIKEAQALLQNAQASNFRYSTDTLEYAGKRFLAAGVANPDAWKVVEQFLNYRTYLDSVTVQLGPQVLLPEPLMSRYGIDPKNFPDAQSNMSMWSSGSSRPEDGAQLQSMASPNLNAGLAAVPSLLTLQAQTVVLDGLFAKKVVFKNSHIIYRGGPVRLQEVYFLNCTFELGNQKANQEFASRVLEAPSTSPTTFQWG